MVGSGGILKLCVLSLPSSAKVALCKRREGCRERDREEREGRAGGLWWRWRGEVMVMAAIVKMEAGAGGDLLP